MTLKVHYLPTGSRSPQTVLLNPGPDIQTRDQQESYARGALKVIGGRLIRVTKTRSTYEDLI